MATTWIVAADESRARMLQVTGRERQLEEVGALVNPAGRAHERDLQQDAEPRFRGTEGPGSDRETRGAKEHGSEVFAREVGKYLDDARLQHRYDQLVLVAPPKFLGALRKELHKEVEKLVADELPKDLSWFSERALEDYFAKGSGRAP